MRSVRGTSTVSYEIQGIDPLQRALRKWLDPELTSAVDKANKAGAKKMAADLKRELKPVSKHMARAVRVKRARTGRPEWVIGSSRKTAFFWPFVIGGTKDHGPRNAAALVFVPGWNPYLGKSSHGVGNAWVRAARVRGVGANPIVERVAKRGEAAAFREVDAEISRSTGT